MHVQRRDLTITKSAEALCYVTGSALLMVCTSSLSSPYVSPYAAGIANRVMLIFLDIAKERFNIRRNSLPGAAVAVISGLITGLLVCELDLKIQRICLVAILIFDFCVAISQDIPLDNNLRIV